jgi:hypothetical protein
VIQHGPRNVGTHESIEGNENVDGAVKLSIYEENYEVREYLDLRMTIIIRDVVSG